MAAPVIRLLGSSFGENVFLYEFVKAGDTLEKHRHDFMHRAFIETGSRFDWFGEKSKGTIEGPSVLTFPAGREHGMVALTDMARCFVVMPRP